MIETFWNQPIAREKKKLVDSMEPNVYAQFQWTIIVFTTKLPFSQYPLVNVNKKLWTDPPFYSWVNQL